MGPALVERVRDISFVIDQLTLISPCKQVLTCYSGRVTSTRDVLLTEGMRLFGERGYAATSVAQIEQAAGLSPGSGSLYKHFRSKEELLSAGLDRLLTGERHPTATARMDSDATGTGAIRPDAMGSARLVEQLRTTVRAGLRRMEEDRDLSRVAFRGLDAFPELLERFGQEEIARLHQEIATLLSEIAGDPDSETDWSAVALVLQGAVAHYWLLDDLFGGHPTGVDEERFVTAAAVVTAAVLNSDRSLPRSD